MCHAAAGFRHTCSVIALHSTSTYTLIQVSLNSTLATPGYGEKFKRCKCACRSKTFVRSHVAAPAANVGVGGRRLLAAAAGLPPGRDAAGADAVHLLRRKLQLATTGCGSGSSTSSVHCGFSAPARTIQLNHQLVRAQN